MLIAFTLFVLVAWGFEQFVKSYFDTGNPDILGEKEAELYNNKALMDSIGFVKSAYSDCVCDFEKDSIYYTIKMNGFSGTLRYWGLKVKGSDGVWKTAKDSLVVE